MITKISSGLKHIRKALLLPIASVALGIAVSSFAHAGTLAVFPDINILSSDNYPLSDNDVVLQNLLGGGSTVLLSDQTALFSFGANVNTFYNSLAGVSSSLSGVDLSGAGALTGVDLLFLEIGFGALSPYSAAEQTAISTFLTSGGNVGIVAEPSSNASNVNSLNALLTGIGSAIQYSTARTATGVQFADTILATTLTTGVNSFRFGLANSLSGGTAAVRDAGLTIFAFEEFENTATVVPLPAAFPLFGTGLGILGFMAWRRRRKETVA